MTQGAPHAETVVKAFWADRRMRVLIVGALVVLNVGSAVLLRVGCGPSECAPYGLIIVLLLLMVIDYTFVLTFRRKGSVKPLSTGGAFEMDLTGEG